MTLKDTLKQSFYQDLQELKSILSPYTQRAYLVGGGVRDLLMGIPPKDLDIEVFDISPTAMQQLMDSIGAQGVGKSFFVYKWQGFDLSLPRSEKKVAAGHRGFEVTHCNDERQASRRRDFTMNAIMIDIFSEKILDFWGGREDIRKKCIKIIDPVSFQEDSLRILRGMRFAAQLGFKLEAGDIHLMRTITLNDLSQERITTEFVKLFHSPHLAYGLYYFLQLGIAERLMGFTLKRGEFLKIARLLQKRVQLPETLQKYLFLYALFCVTKTDRTAFFEALKLPKKDEMFLMKQKCRPKNCNRRFYYGLATRYPLNEWLGYYFDTTVFKTVDFDMTTNFTGGITSTEVINDGFTGAQIGCEIRRRILEKIRVINVT